MEIRPRWIQKIVCGFDVRPRLSNFKQHAVSSSASNVLEILGALDSVVGIAELERVEMMQRSESKKWFITER